MPSEVRVTRSRLLLVLIFNTCVVAELFSMTVERCQEGLYRPLKAVESFQIQTHTRQQMLDLAAAPFGDLIFCALPAHQCNMPFFSQSAHMQSIM